MLMIKFDAQVAEPLFQIPRNVVGVLQGQTICKFQRWYRRYSNAYQSPNILSACCDLYGVITNLLALEAVVL